MSASPSLLVNYSPLYDLALAKVLSEANTLSYLNISLKPSSRESSRREFCIVLQEPVTLYPTILGCMAFIVQSLMSINRILDMHDQISDLTSCFSVGITSAQPGVKLRIRLRRCTPEAYRLYNPRSYASLYKDIPQSRRSKQNQSVVKGSVKFRDDQHQYVRRGSEYSRYHASGVSSSVSLCSSLGHARCEKPPCVGGATLTLHRLLCPHCCNLAISS